MFKFDNKINSLKRVISEIEIELDYIDNLSHREEKIDELNHYKKELQELMSKKKKK